MLAWRSICYSFCSNLNTKSQASRRTNSTSLSQPLRGLHHVTMLAMLHEVAVTLIWPCQAGFCSHFLQGPLQHIMDIKLQGAREGAPHNRQGSHGCFWDCMFTLRGLAAEAQQVLQSKARAKLMNIGPLFPTRAHHLTANACWVPAYSRANAFRPWLTA